MATSSDSVELVGDRTATNLARTALFAALMGAFAYVSFPNPLAAGVPVTLQVLGVFLAGIYLGPAWGAVATALYLVAGAAGVPVFAGGGAGVGSLIASPTAGYLWAYPFAAAAVGAVVHGRGRGGDGDGLCDPSEVSVVRLVAATVAGTVVVYAFGVVGYAVFQRVGLVEAFLVAALAFAPAEALKIAAAVGIARSDAVAAD